MPAASVAFRDPADYLHLLPAAAAKYLRSGRDFEDLTQSGYLGLADACRNFDPSKGVRFETWAIIKIRDAIYRDLMETDLMIRVPPNLAASLRKPPPDDLTPAELARREAAEAAIHARIFGDHNRERGTLADLIEARQDSEEVDHGKVLAPLLAALPRRQRQMVEMYYGLGGTPALSFDAIGKTIGVAGETARRDFYRGVAAMSQMARDSSTPSKASTPIHQTQPTNGVHHPPRPRADVKASPRECPSCHRGYGLQNRCYNRDCKLCSVGPKAKPPAPSKSKAQKRPARTSRPTIVPPVTPRVESFTPTRPPSPVLHELAAMEQIATSLASLHPDSAARVVAWAACHYRVPVNGG